jgi:flavin reductase (DIM6/NTAB) family NADH-FMN oxidoreductase RutF
MDVTSGTEIAMGFDQRELRHALGRFATGVAIVTTRTPGGKREGLTANSFGALSLDPPLVLWSLSREAMSLQSFQESPYFAVSVLASHQRDLSNRFGRSAPDKFEGIDCPPGLGGCPTIPGCLALFECRRERTIEGGDHVVLIGRVERFRWRHGDPLVFACGHYGIAAALPDDPRADIAPSDFADLML